MISEESQKRATRRVTTAVSGRHVVRDQQNTIVIGGLMQMRDENIATKVPLLGDGPVLGHLFKYTRKTKKKMNLLIILTPYIIKDNLDLEMIRSRKQREYDEFFSSHEICLEGRGVRATNPLTA